MFGFGKKKDEDTSDMTETAPGQAAGTEAPATGQKFAKGTEIRYDSHLVDRLQGDHKTLLQIYTDIINGAEKRNYKVIMDRLAKFRIVLTEHLLTENVKLYVYLDNELADDEMNSELIRSFRREMDEIGKTVMRMLRKYGQSGVNDLNVEEFTADFGTLGEVLGDRIQREESTLYLLYTQLAH